LRKEQEEEEEDYCCVGCSAVYFSGEVPLQRSLLPSSSAVLVAEWFSETLVTVEGSNVPNSLSSPVSP
jgi:hypothetical protein